MLQWAIPVDGLQGCVNGFLGFELPLTWHGALVGFWCLVPQGLISFADENCLILTWCLK